MNIDVRLNSYWRVMKMIYGYCRISTEKQSIERQIRNLMEYDKDIKIYQETFTGRKLYERKKFQELLKRVKAKDTIVFDSVSRMSRNSVEGINLYFELMEKGVSLVFLKEPYINTEVYSKAISTKIALTDNDIANEYIQATNKVLKLLAKQQIEIAFNQSEKEVKDLSQRTIEGIQTARIEGKQIGRVAGADVTTRKGQLIKKGILAKSKDFNGTLNDKDLMVLLKTTRNTYYKYKKELTEDR